MPLGVVHNVDRIRTGTRIRFRRAHPSGIQVDTGAWHELDRALFRSSIEQRFCQPSLCFERRRSTPSLRSDAAELHFVKGPNDEKIDAVAITAWCKRRPTRKEPPPPK